jgi:hypothetical protein
VRHLLPSSSNSLVQQVLAGQGCDCVQIQQNQLLVHELQSIAAREQPPPPRSCLGKLPLLDFAYRRTLALHQSAAAAAKSTETAIQKDRDALAEAQQRSLQPADDAVVVVFNHSIHAVNMYRDLSQQPWQRIAGCCGKPAGPLLADVGQMAHGTPQNYPEAVEGGAAGGRVRARVRPSIKMVMEISLIRMLCSDASGLF